MAPAIRRTLKRQFYAAMVWNMRWMTRRLGFVSRPLVRWYARQEVIACGLRTDAGGVTVIYTPGPGRRDHRVVARSSRSWRRTPTERTVDFSGGLVHQLCLLEPVQGGLYRVEADRGAGATRRRKVTSPLITVKPSTDRRPELLAVEPRQEGGVSFRWRVPPEADPMIFFLALENVDGEALAGIYTREESWTYPRLERASLALAPAPLGPLEPGGRYTARLLFVDFDGWVSHLAEVSFPYPG